MAFEQSSPFRPFHSYRVRPGLPGLIVIPTSWVSTFVPITIVLEVYGRPFLYRSTLGTLHWQCHAPWLVVAVGPNILSDVQNVRILLTAQGEMHNACVHTKAWGLPQNILESLGELGAVNDNRFCHSHQRFCNVDGLETGGIKCQNMRYLEPKIKRVG